MWWKPDLWYLAFIIEVSVDGLVATEAMPKINCEVLRF